MNTKNNSCLWINYARSCYFLIPNDRKLPSGEFLIQTLVGEEKNIDAAALASFEITEEAAKAYLQAEIEQALEQVRITFSNLMSFSDQTTSEVSSSTSSSDQQQDTINLINTLIGTTPEEFQHNSKAVQVGLLNLYSELKEVLGGFATNDFAPVEAVRTRLRSLRETLQAQGTDIGGEVEELPDKLQAFFASSEYEQFLNQITTKLRQFSDRLEQSPTAIVQSFDELVISLCQILEADETRLQEERQREYTKSATTAISLALSNFEMPSHDFQSLLTDFNHQLANQQKPDIEKENP
jgi:hypothetical protein